MSTTNFLLKNNITIVRVKNITKSLILQHKLIYIEYRQRTQQENKSKLSEHLNCVYAKVYIKNFACKLRFLIQYLKINFNKQRMKRSVYQEKSYSLKTTAYFIQLLLDS